MRVIAFDATPLTPAPQNFGGHAVRGIGRYIVAVLSSLAAEEPEWAARHLLPVRTSETELTWWPGSTVTTRRVRRRTQDTAWWTAPGLDSAAVRSHRVAAWQVTDPSAPLSPMGGGRSIVTAYDLIPLSDPRVMATIRSHRRLVYRLYLQRLRRADLVIAISRTTAEELERRLAIKPDRIAIVYPGMSLATDAPKPTADAGPADLLFVGVPQPHKNAPAAIDALAAIRRRGHAVRLRFAGPQPRPAREALTAHAAGARMSAYVEWLDIVDDEALTSLYRTSVLLALSSAEGLGLTPLEALSAGGRVVCGPAPAFRETLGDAGTFADPADPESVADAYEAQLARSVTGLPADVVARFSPSSSARASIKAYERLLG